MPSYRHLSHAGNPADVLKHLLLVEVLRPLTGQTAPFAYIETHAGADNYRLDHPLARGRDEHLEGIARLMEAGEPELQPYLEIMRHFNPGGRLCRYPGSPKIAAQLLREQDRGWLFELDPDEFLELRQALHEDRRFQLFQGDGLTGLLRLQPTSPATCCVLIDPPYATEQEYDQAVTCMIQACRLIDEAIHLLWYPVIEPGRIDRMAQLLIDNGLPPIQRFELQHANPHPSSMWASGLFVVNPPPTLLPHMQRVLPILAERLGDEGVFGFHCTTLSK